MSKRQVSPCLVFLLISVMGAILALDPSMGQVRFDEPVNLSQNHAVNWTSEIVAAGDQVFVYWLDYTRPSGQILAAHSGDRGMTFRNWNLSAEIPRSYPPAAAADKENVYVAWLGFPDPSDLFTTGLFLSRSNDHGQTFEPPFDITGRGGYGEANMHIQNSILNVAWSGSDRHQDCCAYFKTIYFAKSTDFGETFTEPVTATSNPPTWGIGSVPELAVDGNNVYVAWLGGRPGLMGSEMYFAPSTDGGKTFHKTINLSNNTEFQGMTRFPQLAVSSNGYVYAAWAQGRREDDFPLLDIFFARSLDGGETFSKPLNLSRSPRAPNLAPNMVTAGPNVYITWNGGATILLSRSTDGGETFGEPQIISRAGFGPQISVIEKGKLLQEGITEDIIYLVWYGGTDRNIAVLFSVSLDGGITFSNPQSISDSGRDSAFPRLAAVGNIVYVTWRENPYNSDAIFIRGHLESSRKTH